MRYASNTGVSCERTEGEIKRLVMTAGGTKFATMQEEGHAVIMFELSDRRVMFDLPLPSVTEFATRTKYKRTVKAEPAWSHDQWEQACRSKWRALFLAIKAKLVSVESGVESFEEAFLAQLLVPGEKKPFGVTAIKAISQAYANGKLPPLLGSGT